MKAYDVVFASANSVHYPKRVTAYLVEPPELNADTGLIHFAHGWGGNRLQYAEMQKDFAQKYNVVGVATEFRQSGYDFDPQTGHGVYVPYDASHWQVIDCLNAVRHALQLYPGVNRQRLISFGGSQGGHIALLMTIFLPEVFALVISACGITHLDALRQSWAGRHFSEDELAVRDVVAMAARIACPVVLMHGTADDTVPETHTRLLEAALKREGKEVRARYIEGGGHGLEPVTTRPKTTVELADDWLQSRRNPGVTDADFKKKVILAGPSRILIIDWSKPPDDYTLLSWEQ